MLGDEQRDNLGQVLAIELERLRELLLATTSIAESVSSSSQFGALLEQLNVADLADSAVNLRVYDDLLPPVLDLLWQHHPELAALVLAFALNTCVVNLRGSTAFALVSGIAHAASSSHGAAKVHAWTRRAFRSLVRDTRSKATLSSRQNGQLQIAIRIALAWAYVAQMTIGLSHAGVQDLYIRGFARYFRNQSKAPRLGWGPIELLAQFPPMDSREHFFPSVLPLVPLASDVPTDVGDILEVLGLLNAQALKRCAKYLARVAFNSLVAPYGPDTWPFRPQVSWNGRHRLVSKLLEVHDGARKFGTTFGSNLEQVYFISAAYRLALLSRHYLAINDQAKGTTPIPLPNRSGALFGNVTSRVAPMLSARELLLDEAIELIWRRLEAPGEERRSKLSESIEPALVGLFDLLWLASDVHRVVCGIAAVSTSDALDLLISTIPHDATKHEAVRDVTRARLKQLQDVRIDVLGPISGISRSNAQVSMSELARYIHAGETDKSKPVPEILATLPTLVLQDLLIDELDLREQQVLSPSRSLEMSCAASISALDTLTQWAVDLGASLRRGGQRERVIAPFLTDCGLRWCRYLASDVYDVPFAYHVTTGSYNPEFRSMASRVRTLLCIHNRACSSSGTEQDELSAEVVQDLGRDLHASDVAMDRFQKLFAFEIKMLQEIFRGLFPDDLGRSLHFPDLPSMHQGWNNLNIGLADDLAIVVPPLLWMVPWHALVDQNANAFLAERVHSISIRPLPIMPASLPPRDEPSALICASADIATLDQDLITSVQDQLVRAGYKVRQTATWLPEAATEQFVFANFHGDPRRKGAVDCPQPTNVHAGVIAMRSCHANKQWSSGKRLFSDALRLALAGSTAVIASSHTVISCPSERAFWRHFVGEFTRSIPIARSVGDRARTAFHRAMLGPETGAPTHGVSRVRAIWDRLDDVPALKELLGEHAEPDDGNWLPATLAAELPLSVLPYQLITGA